MKKVKSLNEVVRTIARAKKLGKRVVSTNGCFDILHVGHVRNLEAAKKLGDILVVGVNSDASVRRYKGAKRPIVPAKERAELIASLECVDHVFIFSEDNPSKWILKLKPQVHVKGKGALHFVEKEAVEQVGGKLKLMNFTKGRSTSDVIGEIVKRYKK